MSMYVVLLDDAQLAEVESFLAERGIQIYRLAEVDRFSAEMVDQFQAKLDRAREKYFPESKPIEYRDAVRILRWAGGNPDHEAIKALIQLSRSFQSKTGTPIRFLGRNLTRLIEGRSTAEILEWAANERGQKAGTVSQPAENGHRPADPVERVRRAARKYSAKAAVPVSEPSDDPFADDDEEGFDL